jgi:hypothetical protein
MLISMSVAASFVGGFAKAPWWFWLLAGLALALLVATDPTRHRASYADAAGAGSIPLLLNDLKNLTTGCLMSVVAFALGTALSWTLPA